MKNYRLVLASVVCAVVFVGCSSSGGDSAPPTAQTVSGVQLSGAISKGIVVDGPVTVEELDSAANAIAVVGTARTGNDGSYQLTLGDNYTGGVLQVTISADENTRMKCDVPLGCGTRTDNLADPNSNSTIDFGEFYKPSALTMTALLPGAEANAVINASVTPFTHTAAARAKAQPTLDATAVANANSEVSNVLGVDILNIAPVDITDAAAVDGASSNKQVAYAALLSAIAMQANLDADDQPLLNDVLDQLVSSLISTTILTADLQVIVDNTNVVLNTIGIVDVTGVLDYLQYLIDEDVDGDGIIEFPPPSLTINDPNLDKVKALMSDIRTWGNVIIAEAGDKASAFSMEVDMASDAVGILGTSAFDALAAAVDVAFLFDEINIGTNLSDYILDPFNPNLRRFSSGQITSSTPGEITITDGVFKGYTVNMTVLLPPNETVGTTFTLGITSVTIAGDDSDLSIPSGTLNVTFAEDYTIDYVTPNTLLDLADLLVDLPNASFIQYKDSSGQTLVNPVTFSGTMNADLDPIPVTNSSVPGGEVLVLPKTMSLTGTISNGIGDSLDASLAANVNNTDTFEFFGDFAPIGTPYSVNHDGQLLFSWTYFDNDPFTPGNDTFTINTSDYRYWANVYWDGTTAYISTMYSFWSTPANSLAEAVAYLGLGSFDVDVWVDNEGVYRATAAEIAAEDFTVNGSMDGKLVDPEFVIEDVNKWIDVDIGLTFGVQLTGLPAASVNINADRTGFLSGQGAVTISYGSRQIEIAATVAENVVTTDYTGSVTITNQDGATIVLDSLVLLSDQVFGTNDLSGVLLYNGIQYGTIEITPTGFLKVSYIDGTFEIF